jgi:hypothetical protein
MGTVRARRAEQEIFQKKIFVCSYSDTLLNRLNNGFRIATQFSPLHVAMISFSSTSNLGSARLSDFLAAFGYDRKKSTLALSQLNRLLIHSGRTPLRSGKRPELVKRGLKGS